MTSIELLKQDLDAELKLGTKMVVNWDMYIEMHKQEIIDAWNGGDYAYFYSKETGRDFADGNDYYQETFVSKGSDTLKDYHIVDANKMVQLPQQEISDESWEGCDGCTEQDKYFWTKGYQAGYNRATPTEISDEEIEEATNNPDNDGYSFRDGAKWYREQLKQKQ